MDMNDDHLVRQFLKSNIRTPEDNGFSERVMSRLPRRPISMAYITTIELVAFATGMALLLTRVDLPQLFCNISMHLLQAISSLRYIDLTFVPIYLVVALAALAVWGSNKIKTLT